MRSKRDFVKGFFLALTIVFFLAEAVTFYWGMVYSSHGLAKLRVVGLGEFAAVRTQVFGIDDELNKLRNEVQPLVRDQDNDFQKALITNEWVMNQISGIGGDLDRSKRTPYAILTSMREGKTGASCGYRALLYLGALRSIGIESRMLTLIKSDGVSTHATVEVLIDDEWVVIDPYFNIYFLIDGKPTSAAELHQLFLKNEHPKNLEVIEGGQVLSAIKFDSPDYLLAYFDYVSIYERRHFFAWQALPILQYFFGVSDVHLGDVNSTIENVVRTRDFMVLAYNFIFPIGFGVSFIALMAALFIPPKGKNSQV